MFSKPGKPRAESESDLEIQGGDTLPSMATPGPGAKGATPGFIAFRGISLLLLCVFLPCVQLLLTPAYDGS